MVRADCRPKAVRSSEYTSLLGTGAPAMAMERRKPCFGRREMDMKRRGMLRAIVGCALLLARALSVAQTSSAVSLIGLLDASDRTDWWVAFREQLNALGYVEGRNVRFESRLAKGELDLLS